ncbi:FKBP-type peptidyl-prolyl cis-trans isomerase [Pedobacter nyackensis]|uniref:Peptidyl-prolyl cis-trans isomerase n=1 Tax=Pedobacter nyackensis TaxID=475255 RepID=A0A1W2ACR1_9SPHI|nr:FKBP-type peptidyl-prolyl cis-trans isomerase [Pedobacter nyackensis]SMC58028.1 FKBP-type peptidyl-prolyl cis-trans isomerase FkpA [Pedobacter nyackensis]
MLINKIKYLVLLAGVASAVTSCKTDIDNFDAAAQFTKDTTAIRSYVTANKIETIKDKSGVFYQVITPGSGTASYNRNTLVTVDYAGKVLGETKNFDSSGGTAREFQLGGLIAGWQIGIPYIQKGAEIRLFIPSQYAYGNAAMPGIPANSVLDFTIKLAEVKNP